MYHWPSNMDNLKLEMISIQLFALHMFMPFFVSSQLDIPSSAREQADVGSVGHLSRIPGTTADNVHERPDVCEAEQEGRGIAW